MSKFRSFRMTRRGGDCPSYGGFFWIVQRAALILGLLTAVLPQAAEVARAEEAPFRIVALGDSLTAGYNLPASAAFPVRLQKALADKGIRAEITNAGVSGDTAADGLARLDWSVAPETEAVIVELGANDALRGLDPAATEKALQAIVARLKQRGLPILLCGMYAPRNMGPDYVTAFDRIYPRLAEREGVLLYPFFLDGVAGDAKLNLADGLHPRAEGVDVIVRGILPKVEALVDLIRARRAAPSSAAGR